MPTVVELLEKWGARRQEWERLGATVSGERIAAEVLTDLRALVDEDVVTLDEAARIGGYSRDHLERLVREGTIENRGRKHAPRIRRADVPTKPGHPLPSPAGGDHFSLRRRIVADAKR